MGKFLWALLLCVPVFAAKLTVAVTLQPYASIVQEIGGSDVDVVALVPPGADPHTFEPKPSSLKEFSKAVAYFSDGSGIDEAWLPRFTGVNKMVKVFALSNGIDWIEGGKHHHPEDRDLDPHLWTSPLQLQRVAHNVCEALASLDEPHADKYRARSAKLMQRLANQDLELRTTIEKLSPESRTFIVFHPAYGYFARDYGMTQLTVEVKGKEPKPRDVFDLIKTGKENHVGIVFVQPQFSKRSAATIAKELNAVILETDPLAFDYESNIRALIKAIQDNVKK
ncbi:MAG: zinc ABC transporter substrate-binding protein [Fibrobacter sp.]|nr:zinc ABC transporter substrate-binding protein [Fibrobacter sp.]